MKYVIFFFEKACNRLTQVTEKNNKRDYCNLTRTFYLYAHTYTHNLTLDNSCFFLCYSYNRRVTTYGECKKITTTFYAYV
jgi:hypothetical protein